jgi:hypothetical protein
MARKVDRIVRRGDRTWLVRVCNGQGSDLEGNAVHRQKIAILLAQLVTESTVDVSEHGSFSTRVPVPMAREGFFPAAWIIENREILSRRLSTNVLSVVVRGLQKPACGTKSAQPRHTTPARYSPYENF